MPQAAAPTATSWSVAPDGVLTVKPSAKLFFKGAGARMLLALPAIVLIVLFGYRGRDLSIEVRLVIALITLAFLIGWLACVLFVSRVRVTPDELVVRSALGVSRRHQRRDLTFGLLLVQYRAAGQAQLTTMVVLADQAGRRVLRMPGQYWDRDGIDQLLRTLALPRVDVVPEPITGKQVDVRYPKLLPLAERRPGLYALIIVLVTFAVIAAGVAVAIALD